MGINRKNKGGFKMNTYDKAKKLLTNLIDHIAFTGQLKTSVHVYNIACAIDSYKPSGQFETVINALFDIVDGKKTQYKKVINQYLKKATID